MEATETRFAHLLKPIRELTQNWDIDIASELNDYLEELEEISITVDDGQITLNFAEAALLIQGSACIYSKKVELLHNLVFQTLEHINDRNKKRAKQRAESAEDGEDQAESNQDKEDDIAFKSVDCVTSNKDCPEDADSTTNVYMPPLPPEALIPFEPREKQRAPLISLKGEDLGSWRDFRISTYIPNAEDYIDIRFQLDSVWSKATGENWRNDHWSLPLRQEPDGPVEAVMGAADDATGAGDDVGGGFLPLEDNGMEMDVEQQLNATQEHIERNQASGEGRVLRERPVQLSKEELKRKEELVAARKLEDIWKLHDPYEEIGENKPLKPGKCYTIPPGLDGGKRKRKADSQIEDFRIFLRGMCDPLEQKLRNGPTFTDLNYIYVSKIKEKLCARKRNLRRAGGVVSDQELEEEFRKTYLQPEGAAQEENEDVEALHLPDLPGVDDDHNSDGEHEALPDFDVPLPASQTDGLSYEDLVQKHVERFLKNTQGYAQVTALSRRVEEWEEKIRPVLEMQETRPMFDIHDYGDKIVESLGSVKHRKTFASIVCGLDSFEACKYMLASLQLANDNTVEIDQAEDLEDIEQRLDTMALTLLCKDRATDRFKNLQSSQ